MGWREEYEAVINEAEAENPVNAELVEQCTKLADIITALKTENKALSSAPAPTTPLPPTTPKPRLAYFSAATPTPDPTPPPKTDDHLRAELAEALRARTQAESRLRVAEANLERVRDQSTRDARALKQLATDKAALTRQLRDRDEELRGKRKLMEEVQDEALTLEMELNVVREKEKETKRENQHLLDRWIKYKNQEVEMINEANVARQR